MFLIMFYFFKLVEFYNYLYSVYNYNVYKIEMTYVYNGIKPINTRNFFWLNEQKFFTNNGEPEEHWVDVTRNFSVIGKIPDGITDVLYRIKYIFRKHKFTCLSKDLSVDVSKIKKNDLKFKMPIKNVYLIDENKNVLKDVTNKYFKLLGPNRDFHTMLTPKVYDLFFVEFEYIQVVDIIGTIKTYDKNSTLDQLL